MTRPMTNVAGELSHIVALLTIVKLIACVHPKVIGTCLATKWIQGGPWCTDIQNQKEGERLIT
jgi:hypothetical protein